LNRENVPPVFRKGSVVIFGQYNTDDFPTEQLHVNLTKPIIDSMIKLLYFLYAIQIFTMPAAIDHFVSLRVL
jgi:hypothetical protein